MRENILTSCGGRGGCKGQGGGNRFESDAFFDWSTAPRGDPGSTRSTEGVRLKALTKSPVGCGMVAKGEGWE